MNVLITLPKHLIDAFIDGKKTIEIRKKLPSLLIPGVEGFFAVEKGTQNVRCYCHVDAILPTVSYDGLYQRLRKYIFVDYKYFSRYAPDGTPLYLWYTNYVIALKNITIADLGVMKNPQQYVYIYPPIRNHIIEQIYNDPNTIRTNSEDDARCAGELQGAQFSQMASSEK